ALQASPPEVQQHISIDIALHYGDAAYGNIGSGNRLDFTAVGRDINILSRLELLCKDVGRPLLMTGAFAAEVAAPVFEIGHFELRGFRQHQSLYGLCQDGEVPAAPTWTDGVYQAVLEVNFCFCHTTRLTLCRDGEVTARLDRGRSARSGPCCGSTEGLAELTSDYGYSVHHSGHFTLWRVRVAFTTIR